MKNDVQKTDKDVDNILDSLTGDLRLGQRYYVFTVTYAYIGRVGKVTSRSVVLEDCTIVSRAGSEDDAVSKIVAGKKKPENCELCPAPITVFVQAITAVIPMMK